MSRVFRGRFPLALFRFPAIPKRVEAWTEQEEHAAKRVVENALSGVGDVDHVYVEFAGLTYQVRRQMTLPEMRAIQVPTRARASFCAYLKKRDEEQMR